MSRMFIWLQLRENQLFHWVNKRTQGTLINYLLHKITHLGGATIAISLSLGTALFAPSEVWRLTGLQALVALAVSHIPVAIIKRKYPRLRPYLVLPETNTCLKPLADHSFPSGHTTAIFALIVPFVINFPMLGTILLPIAFLVGYSRIYLGLHYPSDCAVGAIIGSLAGLLTVIFWS